MPKKTVLLIIFLTLITAGLLYLAINESAKIQNIGSRTEETPTITEKPVLKTVELSFSPNEININPGVATPSSSADILINANQNKVSGVQLELTFDPNVISNIQISEPQESFFGEKGSYIVLFKDIDYKNGRISYAVAISPSSEAKTGSGKVATLNFTARNTLAQSKTEIAFIGKTMVTELNTKQSVLKNSEGFIINFTSNQTINSGSGSGQICAQILTPAKDPQTGTCNVFSTPCDVPQGWVKVSACSTPNETIN